MPAGQDLTGKIFGRYTVLRFDSKTKHGGKKYLCKCICGTEKVVQASLLKRGTTVSCGCYHLEVISKIKHGERNTSLYSTWQGMLSRCNLKTHQNYKHYGGRGIKVCDEWKDFILFKEWAINNGYSTAKTIDRKDNDKGYNPENCRWVELIDQVYNKRSTVICNINGENLNTKQIFEKYGIGKKIIYYRVNQGMLDQDLIKPIRKLGKTN